MLDLVYRGFVSDPEGVEMYEELKDDENGLKLYRCLRGTNAAEGMHAKMIRNFSMFGADPLLTHAWLTMFRHQHNTRVWECFECRFDTK